MQLATRTIEASSFEFTRFMSTLLRGRSARRLLLLLSLRNQFPPLLEHDCSSQMFMGEKSVRLGFLEYSMRSGVTNYHSSTFALLGNAMLKGL